MKSFLRNHVFRLVLGAIALGGCGANPASAQCSLASDCSSGFSCMGFATFYQDGGCSVSVRAVRRAECDVLLARPSGFALRIDESANGE
jgi:hypothetical protein